MGREIDEEDVLDFSSLQMSRELHVALKHRAQVVNFTDCTICARSKRVHSIRPKNKVPVFKETRPHLNLLVKPRIFSGFNYDQKMCVPTLPKPFRPATRNYFFIWPNTIIYL